MHARQCLVQQRVAGRLPAPHRDPAVLDTDAASGGEPGELGPGQPELEPEPVVVNARVPAGAHGKQQEVVAELVHAHYDNPALPGAPPAAARDAKRHDYRKQTMAVLVQLLEELRAWGES
jgi:hypothetical protein